MQEKVGFHNPYGLQSMLRMVGTYSGWTGNSTYGGMLWHLLSSTGGPFNICLVPRDFWFQHTTHVTNVHPNSAVFIRTASYSRLLKVAAWKEDDLCWRSFVILDLEDSHLSNFWRSLERAVWGCCQALGLRTHGSLRA